MRTGGVVPWGQTNTLASAGDAALGHQCIESHSDADLACPHSVQFYDVVVNGVRYERAAWSYEAPLPSLRHVGGRFGFWHEVEVA
jgi:hypothetical protein